jgi:hypothetical protein
MKTYFERVELVTQKIFFTNCFIEMWLAAQSIEIADAKLVDTRLS